MGWFWYKLYKLEVFTQTFWISSWTIVNCARYFIGSPGMNCSQFARRSCNSWKACCCQMQSQGKQRPFIWRCRETLGEFRCVLGNSCWWKRRILMILMQAFDKLLYNFFWSWPRIFPGMRDPQIVEIKLFELSLHPLAYFQVLFCGHAAPNDFHIFPHVLIFPRIETVVPFSKDDTHKSRSAVFCRTWHAAWTTVHSMAPAQGWSFDTHGSRKGLPLRCPCFSQFFWGSQVMSPTTTVGCTPW